MPSTIPPVTLTLGGNDIQDIDGIFLMLQRGGPGELARLRGRHYVAPRLAGRVRGNRLADLRRVTLIGYVRGSGATEADQRGDYWDNRILLASWLPVNTETELLATLPSGDTYSLNVLPIEDDPILYNEELPSFALCSVSVESLDPDWTLEVGS